ncbi:probable protein phosphatase 2C T23F11.1 isoform X1 [Dreissena polymorpha]|uniref:probable protein phosphatase 2C T23F11.1 isoform X1 n=1 Tax=Dreissena polymorpha TaxID=45954 RepID=UPI002264C3FA|nr:probable protein phosphatase 2C T23F11.1 isoform X1 [Dreissena polymorpha]XP_052277683.1 probable protein phosphatase 2C T23F11.1 isoform X1 [Dreissena polymorpha]XP_052277684.1 probable protein phosphatase 2C T23F11.1 isoform X1 [Dreissena polymorpha]XP_052277686.1 probable protein phosphatase 2C T23F11.1 isoform X1 [Dreissena polymorpha]
MGQTLSEPVTTKETTSCQNAAVRVGASCMQGWRINMEDAHTQLLTLPGDKDAMFFGVFDGHGESTRPKDGMYTGGAKVAHYASMNLHKKIITQPAYAQNRISEALKGGFLQLDEDMIKDDTMKEELAGTTAITVLVKNSRIYCANVGDSRAVASVRGRVDVLSNDHKPGNEGETRRIIAAGGWVEFNRVNGNLALSRALGDFIFKKNDKKKPEEQIVTAYPDVQERQLSSDFEFIVLACDGIWDVLTNQEVVDFVRARLAQRMEPETICEELMMRCLAPDCQMGGLGCDNMTVCLVCFLHGRPYEDLIRRCAQPCIGGPVPHLNNYDLK